LRVPLLLSNRAGAFFRKE